MGISSLIHTNISRKIKGTLPQSFFKPCKDVCTSCGFLKFLVRKATHKCPGPPAVGQHSMVAKKTLQPGVIHLYLANRFDVVLEQNSFWSCRHLDHPAKCFQMPSFKGTFSTEDTKVIQ